METLAINSPRFQLGESKCMEFTVRGSIFKIEFGWDRTGRSNT